MDKKKFALIIKDRLSLRETEEGAAKMMGSSNGQKNITVDAQDAMPLFSVFYCSLRQWWGSRKRPAQLTSACGGGAAVSVAQ
jgi:hypothetical protein